MATEQSADGAPDQLYLPLGDFAIDLFDDVSSLRFADRADDLGEFRRSTSMLDLVVAAS
jgi:hypothetical protein